MHRIISSTEHKQKVPIVPCNSSVIWHSRALGHNGGQTGLCSASDRISLIMVIGFSHHKYLGVPDPDYGAESNQDWLWPWPPGDYVVRSPSVYFSSLSRS